MDKSKLKIGVYVLNKYANRSYSKDNYNKRGNIGMAVVCDVLERAGFTNISFCSACNVTSFDMVMFSVTGFSDWFSFIAERVTWVPGKYKVVVGGQGALNPRPFLEYVDYFVLGRAEGIQPKLAECILSGTECNDEHVVSSKSYSVDKIYYVNQTDRLYPYELKLSSGKRYKEDCIGCNHKCFFCSYTWQRKFVGPTEYLCAGLWNDNIDRERAMLDVHAGIDVDLDKLRTTALDGLSERLRLMVNKRITRDIFRDFIEKLALCQKPHFVKIYNILGLPTETEADWAEYLEDIIAVDKKLTRREPILLILHSTPFHPMPPTPMACAPMSYKDYRGAVARRLGKGHYPGRAFYEGNRFACVESMYEESLPTTILNAIIWRGTEEDTDNIVKIACSKKFSAASTAVKQATLEKYFDVARLFGAYTPESLPTRNIRTYLPVEKAWARWGGKAEG